MYPVSDEYLTAIQDNTRSYYFAGCITTKAGIQYPFTNKDIVKGSGYITNQCCGSNEIEIGSVYAAEMGITLYMDIDRYTMEGATVTISFFLELDSGKYEKVPLGIFEVSEANRTINCLAIKAYDYMLRFDRAFGNKVSSGTAYDLLALACTECNVEFAHTKEEIDGMPNGRELLGIYPENDIETWRDLIFYVAQVLGCFSFINRYGKLQLKKYGTEPVAEISDRHRFSSSFSDFITRYTAVSSTNVRTQESEYYALETDDALTMNLGVNPLLQFGLVETRRKMLVNILNDISCISYVPFDSSTIGDPALDIGDVLIFSGGHADEKSITAVTSVTYNINGKQTLKCVGKNPRLSQAKSKNDKNIAGLMNSIEAEKITVHSFINASPYSIGENNTEVVNMEFATTGETDVQFHASILMDVSAKKCIKYGTAKGTISLEDEEGQEETKEIELAVEVDDDGEAVFTVTYILNDETIKTYVPVETYHSGKHILNLYYPMTGLASNKLNSFRVWINATGGTAQVGRNQAIATISGQGLGAGANWNGTLEFSDDMELLSIGGRTLRSVSDELQGLHIVRPEGAFYKDTMKKVSDMGLSLYGMEEQEIINEVIRTTTIDESAFKNLQMDRRFVGESDRELRLIMEYEYQSRSIPIDRGAAVKVVTDTGQFLKINGMEVYEYGG